MGENYILSKDVDWSFLHRGFAIPVAMQPILSAYLTNGALKHGEKRHIKIILNNQIYIVSLVSVNFNKGKYPNHKDMWQVLYTQNGEFAKNIRVIFYKTFQFLYEMKKYRNATMKLPKNEREFIALYTTEAKDIFYAEPFFNAELNIPDQEKNEQLVEGLLNLSNLTDPEATIVQGYRLQKIRKLNRDIGNYLKKIYSFRCQICGEDIGKCYDAKVVECHHINYFINSLDNNINNLLIICPNHHRIIHSTNPSFDFDRKLYRYPNGYEETLKLNLHL